MADNDGSAKVAYDGPGAVVDGPSRDLLAKFAVRLLILHFWLVELYLTQLFICDISEKLYFRK